MTATQDLGTTDWLAAYYVLCALAAVGLVATLLVRACERVTRGRGDEKLVRIEYLPPTLGPDERALLTEMAARLREANGLPPDAPVSVRLPRAAFPAGTVQRPRTDETPARELAHVQRFGSRFPR